MPRYQRILLIISGEALAGNLTFGLDHDRVKSLAAEVADAVRAAAADAGRLLFGELPVDFPLTVATVDNYGQAK